MVKKKNWFKGVFFRRLTITISVLSQLVFLIVAIIDRSKKSALVTLILSFISLVVLFFMILFREKSEYRLAWSTIVIFFPIFGGLLYLFFNYQTSFVIFKERLKRTKNKANNTKICTESAVNRAIAQLPQFSKTINYLENNQHFPLFCNTKTTYFSPADNVFETLIDRLNRAEKYIFIEFFIIEEGKFFNPILEILKRKAKEGVKVRILYDDVGCFLTLPSDYPKQLKEYSIECCIFNKLTPILQGKINNRDHRKIISIDGKYAFTGGANLADEYINEVERFGHWKDCFVLLEGDAAKSFTLMFLQTWEVASGKTQQYQEYFKEENSFITLPDEFVQPYSDNPLDNNMTGEQTYLSIINSAKKYLYITTPYFVVDKKMVNALKNCAKRGVDVRIITPHIWDKRYVHELTRSYYKTLIKSGVKIYEYRLGFIHSKTFLCDDSIATVGTINLDFRSLYLNFENGVVLYKSSCLKDMKDDFLKTQNYSIEIKQENCVFPLFTRLYRAFLRIFAPLI